MPFKILCFRGLKIGLDQKHIAKALLPPSRTESRKCQKGGVSSLSLSPRRALEFVA